jgi:hypothetical protein
MTCRPAAAADRSPLLESSTATAWAGGTPSRSATVRYTSGAGLPCATSSVDTVAANSGAIAAAASTAWIRTGGEELASPSGQPAAIRRTADTAPGMSGRSRA